MEQKPKSYKMLKAIRASRDNINTETFEKGSVHHDLPDDLVVQFYEQGAIEEVGSNAKANPADSRETKVTAPSAYKGQEGEAGIDPKTQRIEELNATARDHYGMETDTTMKPQAIREAIDKASDGKETDLPKSGAEPLTTESMVKGDKAKKKK